MGIFSSKKNSSFGFGFGFSTTAEQVAAGLDGSGLTAIITGGNTGIGAETARVLAAHGVRVVIAARRLDAAEVTRDAIRAAHPAASVLCMTLDLADLSSVRRFADEYLSSGLPLNILINNAGIMFFPFELSPDGIEMQFATNHIGHFLLTDLLLPLIKRTAAESGVRGRIVNLSSVAHATLQYKSGVLRSAAEVSDPKIYNQNRAYGHSKLANLLHARRLAVLLKEEGADVTVNAVHPGLIKTGLWKHSALMTMVVRIMYLLKWKTVEEGAATTVYAALHPAVREMSGEYLEDCGVGKSSKLGNDPDAAIRMWRLSEEVVALASQANKQ